MYRLLFSCVAVCLILAVFIPNSPVQETIILRDVSKSIAAFPLPDSYTNAFDFAENIYPMQNPINPRINTNQTDIEQALLHVRQLPAAKPTKRRVILYTDGHETIGNAISALSNRTFRLDIVPTGSIRAPDPAVLSLVQENGIPIAFVRGPGMFTLKYQEHTFNQSIIDDGEHRITFQPIVPGNGLQRITLTCIPHGYDSVPENNHAEYVWWENLGKDVTWIGKTPPLNLNFNIKHFSTNDPLPTQSSLYVLDHVQSLPIDSFAAIFDAAAEGAGLLMIGGPDDEYGDIIVDNVPVQNRLPLNMTPEDALGISIAVDVSGSMSGGKLAKAMGAILSMVSTLQPSDLISIDGFANEIIQILPITEVRNLNIPALRSAIANIPASGGTKLFKGIRQAIQSAKDMHVQARFIIIITDFEATEKRGEDAKEWDWIRDQQTKFIVLNMDEIHNAELRQDIESVGGKFVSIGAMSIGSWLIREQSQTRELWHSNAIIDNAFGWAKSITHSTLSNYRAYGNPQPHHDVQIWLSDEKNRPLAASCNYKLGRIMMLAGRPDRDWGWGDNGVLFLEQVLNATVRLNRNMSNTIRLNNNRLKITLSTEEDSVQHVIAHINDSNGNHIKKHLLPVSAGIFYLEAIAFSGLNHIRFIVDHETVSDGVILNENRLELLHFGNNESNLAKLAEAGGGKIILDNVEKFNDWDSVPLIGRKIWIDSIYLLMAIVFFMFGLILKMKYRK